jgi:hypothetical protein
MDFFGFYIVYEFFYLISSIVLAYHPVGQGGSVWSGAPTVVVMMGPSLHPRQIMRTVLLAGEILFIHFRQFTA